MNPDRIPKSTAMEQTKPGAISPQVRGYLDSLKPALAKLLPKHLSAERFLRLVGGVMVTSPKIAKCSLASIGSVLATCSQLGLEPGPLGHVYLIPRDIWDKEKKQSVTTLTMIVGYKGYLELARRTGKILRANARVVYRTELEQGLFSASHEPPTLTHRWAPGALSEEDRIPDNIVASYAVIETCDGGRYQWVMDRTEIEARRKRNPAVQKGASSPWDTDYAPMAAKCPFRALFASGVVPLSSELAQLLAADDDGTGGQALAAGEIIDMPATEPIHLEVHAAEPSAEPEMKSSAPPPAESPLGDEGKDEAAKLDALASAEGISQQKLAGLRSALSMSRDPTTWTARQCQALAAAIEAEAGRGGGA